MALGTVVRFSYENHWDRLNCSNRFVRGGYNSHGNNLIKGTDSYYYGMTPAGGIYGAGTIFKMTSSGSMPFVKSLGGTEGQNPYGTLIQASDGNFYGMTYSGGTSGCGTIFKMTSSGVITVIKSLEYYTTGGNPRGSLIQGSVHG